ncbi:flagellar FliJ family protein [Nisaea acidiphila]|uniref:Flagellar FliJ protein n=1 Tax=Nisaea acidiphila TaxID=1862145 RepID=A0A9J7AVN0_9PROT|nr:flagellar FliJ family protein [Nisaea acidiphila]UUX50521.1 flagellar FliJ family protein [Nisaea acidiphila]
MSQFEQLVRLRTWELDEKRRAMGVLLEEEAAMIAETEEMDREFEREKQAAGGSLEARRTLEAYMVHFKQREQALAGRIAQKRTEIDAANEEVLDAYQELRKAEAAQEQHEAREAERVARLEQMELDEIALNMMKRREG